MAAASIPSVEGRPPAGVIRALVRWIGDVGGLFVDWVEALGDLAMFAPAYHVLAADPLRATGNA